MDINDQARGAILGMAMGEALGAPLEGLTPEDVEKRAGLVTGFQNPRKTQPEYRAAYFQARTYEDETQAALAAVDVLRRGKGFRVESFQERLGELGQPVEGQAFGCFRRARRNLRVAVRRILGGADWKESGVNTAGSSAASRGIPIGVYYREDAEKRRRAAIEAALVTHRDPRACAAALVVAELTALAIRAGNEGLDPEKTVDALVTVARDGEDFLGAEYSDALFPESAQHLHQFSDAVSQLKQLLDLDVEEAEARIVAFATDKASRPITSATKGFALTGVISALYFFLTGLDAPYRETVLDAVSEGGSSDTVGCIVGGLCGALKGVEDLPADWIKELRNSTHIDRRASALVSEEPVFLTPLVLMEAKLMRRAVHSGRRRQGSSRRRGQARGRFGRGGGHHQRGFHQRGGAPRRGAPRRGGSFRGRPAPARGGYRNGGPRTGGGGYRGGQRSGYRGGSQGGGGGYRGGGSRGPGGGYARPGGSRGAGGRRGDEGRPAGRGRDGTPGGGFRGGYRGGPRPGGRLPQKGVRPEGRYREAPPRDRREEDQGPRDES